MKKIGLVGGTGPESTLMYYRELNARADARSGGKEMPDLVIESVNFPRAWSYVCEGRYEELASYLSEKVEGLKAAGAEIISLTAGTMHLVYDEIESKTGTELVSIPKAVSEEALLRGYKRVVLLGTIFTMEQDYMKRDFQKAGIEVIIPDKEARELVARRIYEELERGIVKESTLIEINNILDEMKACNDIDAVVLGCTELPLLLKDENCVLPCLDSVDIHIEKLLKMAL